MPIAQEMTEANTLSFNSGISSSALRWFAIQTRSRHEVKVKAQLDAKQIAAFLPMIKEVHLWSDRRKIIEQPLFPGYVFVRMAANHNDSRISVLKTTGTVGFVGSQGIGDPIPDKQIEDVQTLITSEVPFASSPFLQVGRRVRIRGGCLDGIEGTLAAKNADRSVVVSVNLVRRSLAVKVSGFDLEML